MNIAPSYNGACTKPVSSTRPAGPAQTTHLSIQMPTAANNPPKVRHQKWRKPRNSISVAFFRSITGCGKVARMRPARPQKMTIMPALNAQLIATTLAVVSAAPMVPTAATTSPTRNASVIP